MASQIKKDKYGQAPQASEWTLRLYVTDWSPHCIQAYKNLESICEEHMPGKCDIEVVDILEEPEAAKRDQVFAVPTLIKMKPGPQRKLVGDLSQTSKVLAGLDFPFARRPKPSTGN